MEDLLLNMALQNATKEELDRAILYSRDKLDVLKLENKLDKSYESNNIAELESKYNK